MINSKTFVTYAQYREDVILASLFYDVNEGFYVDVGANYPTIDSVTKLFYDKGWSGINIEPLKNLFEELCHERPRDINLNVGVGKNKNKANFTEYINLPGHSTFDVKQKGLHVGEKHIDYQVEILPLKEIFKEYKINKIHFLKVDVEGFESDVIEGNDWNIYRPEVICIEANHVNKDWRPIILNCNYNLFIKDGLNEYYVADEALGRTKDFTERVVAQDYYALKQHQMQSWQADISNLNKVLKSARVLEKEKEEHIKTIDTLRSRTLYGLSLPKRIKRAAYFLTVDWYREKSKKNL